MVAGMSFAIFRGETKKRNLLFMATWDTPPNLAAWDKPVTWDALPEQGKQQTKMITLITSLTALKPEDQASKMDTVKTALTTNALIFPDLPVPLATYAAKVAAIKQLLSDIKTKEQELKSLRLSRPGLLAEGQLMYSQNAAYVVGLCGDDASKAALSGYEVASQTSAPAGALGQVENLSVTTGDNAGELDLHHNPVHGASAYESEISVDGSTNWMHASTTGISKETLTGLPSLTIRWVRTRAVKGNNHGPWSDPAKGLVP